MEAKPATVQKLIAQAAMMIGKTIGQIMARASGESRRFQLGSLCRRAFTTRPFKFATPELHCSPDADEVVVKRRIWKARNPFIKASEEEEPKFKFELWGLEVRKLDGSQYEFDLDLKED